MYAAARQSVEVGRERGHQGLAFTGLHFGDPAEVQRGTAHHLDVVVALADGSATRLTNHREGLDQEIVERLATLEALTEFGGLAT